MSVPKPREIAAIVSDIKDYADNVANEYAWLYSSAYDRTVRDEPKVNIGGRADPTGSITMGKAYMRRALERAYRDLRSVSSQLREIEVTLAKALEGDEPRERPEPHFPRTASPDDVAASKEAQQRRWAAGGKVP